MKVKNYEMINVLRSRITQLEYEVQELVRFKNNLKHDVPFRLNEKSLSLMVELHSSLELHLPTLEQEIQVFKDEENRLFTLDLGADYEEVVVNE